MSLYSIFTRTPTWALLFLGLMMLSGVVLLVWPQPVTSEQVATTKPTQEFVASSSTVFLYPIHGIVQPTEVLVVRAETAGTVQKISTYSGSRVEAGQILVQQQTPTLSAERQLVDATTKLDTLAQQRAQIQQLQAEVSALADLQNVLGTDERRKEADQSTVLTAQTQLQSTLENIMMSVPLWLQFVKNNRQLFTSDSLEKYDEVLGRIYYPVPNYMQGPTLLPRPEGTNLVRTVTDALATTSSVVIQDAAQQMIPLLQEVEAIYADSERVFLASDSIARTDARYKSYLEYRNIVSEMRQTVEQASITLEKTTRKLAIADWESVSAETKATINQDTQIALSDITRNVSNVTAQKNRAELQLINTRIAQGVVTAPFTGVVEDVLVGVGEYVQAGTPLLILQSDNAHELMLDIPTSVAQYFSEGAAVKKDGDTIARLRSVTPTHVANTSIVYIDVTREVTAGDVLHAQVEVDTDGTDLQVVPRGFVRFGSQGSFVQTKTGTVIPVRVVMDMGSSIVTDTALPASHTLAPATGIRFLDD